MPPAWPASALAMSACRASVSPERGGSPYGHETGTEWPSASGPFLLSLNMGPVLSAGCPCRAPRLSSPRAQDDSNSLVPLGSSYLPGYGSGSLGQGPSGPVVPSDSSFEGHVWPLIQGTWSLKQFAVPAWPLSQTSHQVAVSGAHGGPNVPAPFPLLSSALTAPLGLLCTLPALLSLASIPSAAPAPCTSPALSASHPVASKHGSVCSG